jgi:hypothetical protein
MVTIAITPEALAIIMAALPRGCNVELCSDGYGALWLHFPMASAIGWRGCAASARDWVLVWF